MKGKANPFANLLSQLSTSAGPSSGGPETNDDMLSDDGTRDDGSGSEAGSETSSSFKFGKTSKLSYCLVPNLLFIFLHLYTLNPETENVGEKL